MSIDSVGKNAGQPIPIKSTEKVENDTAGNVATESKQTPVGQESGPKDAGLKALEHQLQEIVKRNQLDEEIKKNHPSGISRDERDLRKQEIQHQMAKIDADLRKAGDTKQTVTEHHSVFKRDFDQLTNDLRKLNSQAPLNAEQQKQKQILEARLLDLFKQTNTFLASNGMPTSLRVSRLPDGSLDVMNIDLAEFETRVAEFLSKTDQSIAKLQHERAELQELRKRL